MKKLNEIESRMKILKQHNSSVPNPRENPIHIISQITGKKIIKGTK